MAGEELWGVIENCLNPAVEGYCTTCRSPLSTANCPASNACMTSTHLLHRTDTYMTMGDRKECGCPGSFVHGLVLPLKRTVGIEDPGKPDGIWAYAWEQARQRIRDESTIALVVNSAHYRSENQLHVHFVQLRDGARSAIMPKAVGISSLDSVWRIARERAAQTGIGEVYAVLVMRGTDTSYQLLVENTPAERTYTKHICRE